MKQEDDGGSLLNEHHREEEVGNEATEGEILLNTTSTNVCVIITY